MKYITLKITHLNGLESEIRHMICILYQQIIIASIYYIYIYYTYIRVIHSFVISNVIFFLIEYVNASAKPGCTLED